MPDKLFGKLAWHEESARAKVDALTAQDEVDAETMAEAEAEAEALAIEEQMNETI